MTNEFSLLEEDSFNIDVRAGSHETRWNPYIMDHRQQWLQTNGIDLEKCLEGLVKLISDHLDNTDV